MYRQMVTVSDCSVVRALGQYRLKSDDPWSCLDKPSHIISYSVHFCSWTTARHWAPEPFLSTPFYARGCEARNNNRQWTTRKLYTANDNSLDVHTSATYADIWMWRNKSTVAYGTLSRRELNKTVIYSVHWWKRIPSMSTNWRYTARQYLSFRFFDEVPCRYMLHAHQRSHFVLSCCNGLVGRWRRPS